VPARVIENPRWRCRSGSGERLGIEHLSRRLEDREVFREASKHRVPSCAYAGGDVTGEHEGERKIAREGSGVVLLRHETLESLQRRCLHLEDVPK
jgi:hypothetical protein